MKKIIIGTSGGKNVAIDIEILLPSRLLLTADSGGGKSYALRRFLEQIFGKVQTITIDPEGEFATLREKFPFVLVGKGGETPADPRSANLLARRLLELKASAVCDLYDLKSHLRHTWVKNFLEGLIEAPKEIRTPCIVVVDEAHVFCPEKGESEAFGPMVDLCTRGRKRGLCPVWATQRLAMISKDASSQLQNRLVGMQFEDVNRKRAAEMLGVLDSDKRAFFHEIQLLEPGNFFALGRAISKERILVQVGAIETTHPKAFEKHVFAPPPAPDKIKALLPKLADLPKEADEQARSEADFRREIRELRAKLTIAQKASVQTPAAKSVPVADEKAIDRAVKLATAPLLKQLNGLKQRVHSMIGKAASDIVRVSNTLQDGLRGIADLDLPQVPAVASLPPVFTDEPAPRSPIAIAPARLPRGASDGDVRLGRIHTEIAGILAGLHPQSIKISVLASMVGRVQGGSFSARLSELRAAGLLADVGNGIVAASEKCAADYSGRFQAPTSTEEVLQIWNPKMGEIHRQILSVLVELGGEPISIEELAHRVGRTPGGSFSARLSEVRGSGLLVDMGRGLVAANKEVLFLNGELA